MTHIRDIDPGLLLDLLLLALKTRGWESYPVTVVPEIEVGCSEVLLWWDIGEKAGITWN